MLNKIVLNVSGLLSVDSHPELKCQQRQRVPQGGEAARQRSRKSDHRRLYKSTLGAPNDADLLIPAIATHEAKLGRVPRLVAADAASYSGRNTVAAKAMGVKRVCVPNRSSKNPERRREQKKRRSVEFARLRLHRYAISRKNRRESALVGDRLMVAG